MSRTWSRSSPQPSAKFQVTPTAARKLQTVPTVADSNNTKCQECGCQCRTCLDDSAPAKQKSVESRSSLLPAPDDSTLHLHQEIEDLKSRLGEKEHQIVTMESQILVHANQYPHGEMAALRESLQSSADRYERLLENYRKLQKVNQGLEDKLLRIADKFEAEKCSLVASVAELGSKLNVAEASVVSLQTEAETYKADCALAIRSLQCRPASQFVSQRIESFPTDVQERLQAYCRKPDANGGSSNALNGKSFSGGGKLIRVPMPTFPPTAVLYSLDQSEEGQDLARSAAVSNGDGQQQQQNSYSESYISAAIVAKILEEREKERGVQSCQQDMSTQTTGSVGSSEIYIELESDHHQHNQVQQGQSQTRSRSSRSPYSGSRSSNGSISYAATANAFQTRPPAAQQPPPPQTVRPRSTPMVNETIII